MSSFVEATVQSVEGEKLVLAFEDGQLLRLPMSACEGTPLPGSHVRVLCVALNAEDAGRQRLARDLLNELLSS